MTNCISGNCCSLNCVHCVKRIEHLFSECDIVHNFWEDVRQMSIFRMVGHGQLTVQDKLFGRFTLDHENPLCKLLNHIIIIAKWYIYSCKYSNSFPNIHVFKKRLKGCEQTERAIAMKNKKLSIHIQKWGVLDDSI